MVEAMKRCISKASSTMLMAFAAAVSACTAVALYGPPEALEPFLGFADKALIAFLSVKLGQRLGSNGKSGE